MRWPRTLRAQFVTVVAAAVILSSVAVIVILEIAREGEIRQVRMSAISERVAASFELIADMAPAQRGGAVRAMTSAFYRYEILPEDPLAGYAMNGEEQRLATAVKFSQENDQLGPVLVRYPPETDVRNAGGGNGNNDRRDGRNDARLRFPDNDRIEISQGIGPAEWLSVRFEAPDVPPRAPDMLIAAALVAILTSAAAAWLGGRVSRPLSALASAADEVARGQVAPRLDARGPDDVRRAAEAFNAMSERVTQTLASHRQLLSAVGHDLRTPISAMRITAEFVKDQDTRNRLTRNLDELQSLTEAVLSAVQSNGSKEMHRVDLAALIESLCEDLKELGQPVEVSVAGPAPCLCRSNDIRRALRNLIENAVRYGRKARVSLESTPTSILVLVKDEGPGIPEARMEDVFEPFVRLEESRSNVTGGSGLGLTLARSIAREHGGDVTLQNRPEGGLQATLRLPRERPGAGNGKSGA